MSDFGGKEKIFPNFFKLFCGLSGRARFHPTAKAVGFLARNFVKTSAKLPVCFKV